jgi:hypothetical protein
LIQQHVHALNNALACIIHETSRASYLHHAISDLCPTPDSFSEEEQTFTQRIMLDFPTCCLRSSASLSRAAFSAATWRSRDAWECVQEEEKATLQVTHRVLQPCQQQCIDSC